MRWHAPLALLLAILSQTGAFQTPDTFSNSLAGDFIQKDPQNIGPDNTTPDGIDETMRFLAKLLVLPWPDGALPILYVERPDQEEGDGGEEMMFDGQDQQVYPAGTKRSRYYRKYPWKRQNSKYDPTNPYICNPSKDEVYRLLVALHEARQGNRDKTVDFCNRKRPAHAVYTNIRFLGK